MSISRFLMRLLRIVLGGVTLLLADAPLKGAEHRVASSAELNKILFRLQPGDSVVMKNGIWQDQAIVFNVQGTVQSPITLRAETPGQAILTGKSSLKIEGEYAVVSGLGITNGHSATDGVLLAGNHCRLTETSVTDSTYKFFIHLAGLENRVDHCYVAGKTSESPTLQVEVGVTPNHHRIDHNHFGPRPPLGRNGGETMRVGYSWQSMSNSSSMVEYNLFDRCDGEIEIISSKSCDNIYRYNTFLDCAGMLTLRHGNRCRVEGNFIIGHHKRGSGGIRVIGDDHLLINNYIEGVTQGAFWITSGIEDSPLKGYFRARNAVIAFNTVVDCAGPYLDLSAGIGSANRTLLPENITIANNLFSVGPQGVLIKGHESGSYHWLANMVWPSAAAFASQTGMKVADPKIERAADGLMRPAKASPIRGSALKINPSITNDIDGQPRTERRDTGCDQISDAPVLNHLLTRAEVGPAWLNRPLLLPPVVAPIAVAETPVPHLNYMPGGRPEFWSIAIADSIMARWPDYTKAYFNSWTYLNGYTLRGFEMLYQVTGDKRYLDYIKRYVDQLVDRNGSFHSVTNSKGAAREIRFTNLDSMMTGNTLVMLYEITHDPRYKIAATTVRRAFDAYPRNSDGGFWHAASLPGQMWIDGIFMGQMFLTRYGKSINDREYACNEAARQILGFARRAEKDSSGLYVHALFESGHGDNVPNWADAKTGLSPEVWSEGLGWYALVLVETLDVLPQNHPQRPAVERVFRRLAAALKRTQDQKTGRWFQVVDKGNRPDNWTETSGSAMFVYALQKGIDSGLLNEREYGMTANNGYRGITANAAINEHGLVDIYSACDGLGVQRDYEHYINCKKSVNAKEAIGSFLWATALFEMPEIQKRSRP